MEFTSKEAFIDYFEKVRMRTVRIIRHIPDDKIDWAYKTGKFSFGDLIRHIGCIESHMYAKNMQDKASIYKGCGKEFGENKEECVEFLDHCHNHFLEIFNEMDENKFFGKCTTPGDTRITVWKWLRLMLEHEIHHRGQIYLMLGMIGIQTPPLYGLTSEQVSEKSKK
jgi:uncharacterized damage-inducible protein DinB